MASDATNAATRREWRELGFFYVETKLAASQPGDTVFIQSEFSASSPYALELRIRPSSPEQRLAAAAAGTGSLRPEGLPLANLLGDFGFFALGRRGVPTAAKLFELGFDKSRPSRFLFRLVTVSHIVYLLFDPGLISKMAIDPSV
jgi:hypothetical protein